MTPPISTKPEPAVDDVDPKVIEGEVPFISTGIVAEPHEFEEPNDRIVSDGQWRMIWRRFLKNRVALVSGIIILFVYFVAAFSEFLAPYPPDRLIEGAAYAPPQELRLGNRGEQGFGLYVNGFRSRVDPESLKRTFEQDTGRRIPVGLFVEGPTYRLFGVVPMERRFIGPLDPNQPMLLAGGDRMGRDLLSRTIRGARVSMSIGIIGVTTSLLLGVLIGGLSGLVGGVVDTLIQRLIDFLHSIPVIPLWMGLAAAVPQTWSPLQVYFAITVLLALVSWTGLAREVRGRFMAMKHEDFVIAARLDGSSQLHLIFKHMVPSFMGHIIASVTLAIPAMILAESALSFIGVGLRPPVVSWGVLLQEAQNVYAVANMPWLFLPGVVVVVTVLAMNFLGDGLIDAADPYAQ